MRSIAESLERLAVNAKVARNSLGFETSILRHSGIWGAADEPMLNNIHKSKKVPKIPLEKSSEYQVFYQAS
jgi:hypothetical protein